MGQRQAQRDVKTNLGSGRTQYRALLENANDAISLLTPEGVILETNRRLSEILQYTHEEMVGHSIRDFAPPGHEQANLDQYVNNVGSAQAHTVPIKRADGKTVYVAFSTAPVEIDGETTVLCIGRDVTESVENARKLAASERHYRSLIESIPDVVWSASLDGKRTYVSPNVERVCGYTPEEFLGDGTEFALGRMHPEDRAHAQQSYDELFKNKKAFDVEYRWQHKNGEWLWIHSRAVIARREDGVEYVDGLSSNITGRKRLEEQLRQSQKMEAVGQLTGGIAHDFNNIVAVILANSHFLIDELGEQDPRRADVVDIKNAAERAASLTRQLLAFSRRQVLAPTVLDLNEVVSGVQKMLRRVIGEDIELSILPGEELGSVRADAGQLEQVMMNLVVNARDAMPTGGKLSIETANVDLDYVYAARHVPMVPGKYVMLTVSDTGCGMDAETKRRIFEPFFTTKEKGKGTGLGLSTSYGIVKQSGGYIWVYSELGRGTAFKIYLPRVDGPPDALAATPLTPADLSGNETILLVEDDETVRSAVERILQSRGYRVHVARNGPEAVAISKVYHGLIDLFLSDVVLPGMSGPEILNHVRRESASIKALFMSGYADHTVLRDGANGVGMSFIQKPFAPEALAKKVRQVLDTHDS